VRNHAEQHHQNVYVLVPSPKPENEWILSWYHIISCPALRQPKTPNNPTMQEQKENAKAPRGMYEQKTAKGTTSRTTSNLD
jgi:hypothetical protein